MCGTAGVGRRSLRELGIPSCLGRMVASSIEKEWRVPFQERTEAWLEAKGSAR